MYMQSSIDDHVVRPVRRSRGWGRLPLLVRTSIAGPKLDESTVVPVGSPVGVEAQSVCLIHVATTPVENPLLIRAVIAGPHLNQTPIVAISAPVRVETLPVGLIHD